MDQSFFDNIRKAANVGFADYCTVDKWHSALEHMANEKARAGETTAQAYSRLLKEDATAKEIYKCMTRAKHGARPRAATKIEQEIEPTDTEKLLAKMAEDRAAKTGESFYQAYSQVLKSEEGRWLYARQA